MGIEEIILLLDYGFGSPTMKVYWLLPGKNLSDGLRIVCSHEETSVMSQLANQVKNFVLYIDHHNHVSNNNWEDFVMNPIDNQQGEKLPSFYNNIQSNNVNVGEVSDVEDSEDSDFYDSENVVEDDDDLFFDNVDVTITDHGVSMRKKGPKSSFVEDIGWDEVDTGGRIGALPESDEEGELGKNLKSFRPEDLNNPIFRIGMKFPSIEVLRKAITEYSMKQRVEIKMPRNNRTRIEAHWIGQSFV